MRRASKGRFWLITAAAVVMMAVTFALGRWQLGRAAEKEALAAEIEAQATRPPMGQAEFVGLQKSTDVLRRVVHLRGLWLGARTVFLDNRQMHGVPGFYVLTPLALEGSEDTVMVQRGWVQRNFEDRNRLQDVKTPTGLVEIDARIVPPPAQLMELGKPAAPPAEGVSPIRQNLDLDAFRTESALPLRTDVSLQQIGAASEGLQRDWPAPALGVEKHYGYAFQWFGLSALVAFLYVWFQFIAPRRRAQRAAGPRHG